MSVGDLLLLARKVTINLVNSATWDTTILYEWIVPTAKRWFVMGGMINRDVNATVTVDAVDASDNSYFNLLAEAAATGVHEWPDVGKINWPHAPLILDPTEKIRFAFGVAQGATAYLRGMVLEIDI